MIGRTNAVSGGGGVEINGTIQNMLVGGTENISKGDFVKYVAPITEGLGEETVTNLGYTAQELSLLATCKINNSQFLLCYYLDSSNTGINIATITNSIEFSTTYTYGYPTRGISDCIKLNSNTYLLLIRLNTTGMNNAILKITIENNNILNVEEIARNVTRETGKLERIDDNNFILNGIDYSGSHRYITLYTYNISTGLINTVRTGAQDSPIFRPSVVYEEPYGYAISYRNNNLNINKFTLSNGNIENNTIVANTLGAGKYYSTPALKLFNNLICAIPQSDTLSITLYDTNNFSVISTISINVNCTDVNIDMINDNLIILSYNDDTNKKYWVQKIIYNQILMAESPIEVGTYETGVDIGTISQIQLENVAYLCYESETAINTNNYNANGQNQSVQLLSIPTEHIYGVSNSNTSVGETAEIIVPESGSSPGTNPSGFEKTIITSADYLFAGQIPFEAHNYFKIVEPLAMNQMYYGNDLITEIDMTELDFTPNASSVNCNNMFYLCDNVTSIKLPAGIKSKNMMSLCQGCPSLVHLDLNGIDVTDCSDFRSFINGTKLSEFDGSVFPNLSVNNNNCQNFFYGTTSMRKVWIPKEWQVAPTAPGYSPFISNGGSNTMNANLQIYTDATSEAEQISSGKWSTNTLAYASSGAKVPAEQIHYGATHDEYLAY